MRRIFCALFVANLICATGYESSHSAPLDPPGLAPPKTLTPVYSHRDRRARPYIVVPLTRRYGYEQYWWPQGQYHWSPFGVERWGFWCEGSGAHRLSC